MAGILGTLMPPCEKHIFWRFVQGMKKGQVYEGLVTELHFPNKGIVTVEEGKIPDVEGREKRTTAVVKGTLTGQRVRFLVNKQRKNRVEGRLLEVLEKSPLEDGAPTCEKFGSCGGCAYQNISYATQLKLKEGQVKELLDGVVAEYQWDGIAGSPLAFGYRNKMEYSFGDEYKDGPLTLGLHKKGSFHDIVSAAGCQLVHPDFGKIVARVQSYFAKKGYAHYHKLRHEGYLRHLLVRRAQKTGELLVALVTTTSEEPDLQPLVDELLVLPLESQLTGILHIYNDSLADTVQSDRTEILYGVDYFYEELLGLRFKISPFSFFQTNSLGAEVLYEKVRSYILQDEETKEQLHDKVIYDLYSGTGTIAQMLAPVAKKVIGVEIVEEAVQAARENAARNHLDNCEFIAGDVLKTLDTISQKPDFIILDPPRDGIHPKALEKIIAYGVEKMVYISCKPTSLVRDLAVLQERGYRMERAVAVDMFPQTGHVETVALLSRVEK